MMISLIAAMSRDFLIGTDRGLPWHLPADLKRFRLLTTGKPVIVGRKTMELLGSPLKNRPHIVMSRQKDFAWAGCQVAHTIEEAVRQGCELLPELGVAEVMVIGGAGVYQLALPFCSRMYLTMVEGTFQGNTFFPEACRPGAGWRLTHQEAWPADDRNPHAHRFEIWDRVTPDVENPTLATRE
jgi:dihydrofolate reductase